MKGKTPLKTTQKNTMKNETEFAKQCEKKALQFEARASEKGLTIEEGERLKELAKGYRELAK